MIAERGCGDKGREPKAHILNRKHRIESTLEVASSLTLLKPVPRDTLPPTRPHLLNLSKQCHQLGIRHSNANTTGGEAR